MNPYQIPKNQGQGFRGNDGQRNPSNNNHGQSPKEDSFQDFAPRINKGGNPVNMNRNHNEVRDLHSANKQNQNREMPMQESRRSEALRSEPVKFEPARSESLRSAETESVPREKPNWVNRFASMGWWIFLVTILLTPLAFLPTSYLPIELSKNVVITIGILLSLLAYVLSSRSERTFLLPPKKIVWSSLLIILSFILSAAWSYNFGKSFFGQGFEVNTASFFIMMFFAMVVAFRAVYRHTERLNRLYFWSIIVFFVFVLFHIIRLIFGAGAMSLGVLSNVTSTIFGGWNDLGVFGLLIFIVGMMWSMGGNMSRKAKIFTWVAAGLGFVTAFIVGNYYTWFVAILIFILMFVYEFVYRKDQGIAMGFWRRISWPYLVMLIVSALLFSQGVSISGPVIRAFGADHAELGLSWRTTLDVASEVVKSNPILGVGINNFNRAYMNYRPISIIQTDAWGVEFNNGFGTLLTIFSTQGVLGMISWVLFLIFLGMMLFHAFKKVNVEGEYGRVTLAQVTGTIFLWLMFIFQIPSHTLFLFTFVMTGISLALLVQHSGITVLSLNLSRKFSSKIFAVLFWVIVLVIVVWLGFAMKNTIALTKLSSGIKQMTLVGNDITKLDAIKDTFRSALSYDNSDVYWRAISEVDRLKALTKASVATTTAAAEEITGIFNDGVANAKKAIAYDPTNYYNHLAEARVSESASAYSIANAYDNAVKAYTEAIKLNPMNPSIYLSLARLHASQNKLDLALQAVGAAIQVKNNYLDAIFLLSQIQVAQGNLKDAIVSTRVATELNPGNPLLFFQLGLLYYNSQDYTAATTALEKATTMQKDYANAKYFLGLSYARLNKNKEAIAEFADLAKTNPDNQEIKFILANLEKGKSPFTDAKPPITATPEKRSTLPVKEKNK